MNRRKRSLSAYTFFEVMVAIAILAGGIVLIFKALLISLNYQNHLTFRLYAMNLLNDRVAFIQRQYQEKGELPVEYNGETFEVILNNQNLIFHLGVNFSEIMDLEDISQMNAILAWTENGRTFRLAHSAYISRLSSG